MKAFRLRSSYILLATIAAVVIISGCTSGDFDHFLSEWEGTPSPGYTTRPTTSPGSLFGGGTGTNYGNCGQLTGVALANCLQAQAFERESDYSCGQITVPAAYVPGIADTPFATPEQTEAAQIAAAKNNCYQVLAEKGLKIEECNYMTTTAGGYHPDICRYNVATNNRDLQKCAWYVSDTGVSQGGTTYNKQSCLRDVKAKLQANGCSYLPSVSDSTDRVTKRQCVASLGVMENNPLICDSHYTPGSSEYENCAVLVSDYFENKQQFGYAG